MVGANATSIGWDWRLGNGMPICAWLDLWVSDHVLVEEALRLLLLREINMVVLEYWLPSQQWD